MKRFWLAVIVTSFILSSQLASALSLSDFNPLSWFKERSDTNKVDIDNFVSCSDSDQGREYFTQGVASVTFKERIGLYGDRCANNNDLIEYTCTESGMQEDYYRCEAGCSEGSCINPQQDDSVIISEEISKECGEYTFSSPINALASSDYSLYSSLNAIDGDPETHWFGNASSEFPKWISFDLGERRCIGQMDLYFFKSDLPLTASIQFSNDNLRWKSLINNVSFKDIRNIDLKTDEKIIARYVRIYETSGKRPFGSLSDIRVSSAQAPDLSLIEIGVDNNTLGEFSITSQDKNKTYSYDVNSSNSRLLAVPDKNIISFACMVNSSEVTNA